jgi:hypothetical protein
MYRPSCIEEETARGRSILRAQRKIEAERDVVFLMADHDQTSRVLVAPAAALAARPRLFAALEAAYPVTFTSAADAPIEATIRFAEHSDEAQVGAPPALIFGTSPRPGIRPATVRLAGGDSLDRILHGLSFEDPLDGPDATGAEREVLASADGYAVWTRDRGPAPVDRVASTLPELAPDQTLRQLLDARTLSLLALVEFLRAHCPVPRRPHLRATFLFDDPNLRRPTYGFIDFRRLLAGAEAHGYHAAMAMIPLDLRRQNDDAVELFRRNPARLSATIHGNNHIAGELFRPRDDEGALAVAAQAFHRAADFERRSGLRIDRVMTPPHGMCSRSSAAALAALGYDALCAIHPLPWREDAPDRPLAGWEPAEFAGGCAVIPRVPLGLTGATEFALRAYLGQPLIVYGHHGDVADGLDLLVETAGQINHLGDVHWCSLGEIATTNVATARRGDELEVRPYAQRVVVPLPAGVETLTVVPPREPEDVLVGWSIDGAPSCAFGSVVDSGSGPARIRLLPRRTVDPASVPTPAPSVWPRLRRTATETRDRLRPLLKAGTP